MVFLLIVLYLVKQVFETAMQLVLLVAGYSHIARQLVSWEKKQKTQSIYNCTDPFIHLQEHPFYIILPKKLSRTECSFYNNHEEYCQMYKMYTTIYYQRYLHVLFLIIHVKESWEQNSRGWRGYQGFDAVVPLGNRSLIINENTFPCYPHTVHSLPDPISSLPRQELLLRTLVQDRTESRLLLHSLKHTTKKDCYTTNKEASFYLTLNVILGLCLVRKHSWELWEFSVCTLLKVVFTHFNYRTIQL